MRRLNTHDVVILVFHPKMHAPGTRPCRNFITARVHSQTPSSRNFDRGIRAARNHTNSAACRTPLGRMKIICQGKPSRPECATRKKKQLADGAPEISIFPFRWNPSRPPRGYTLRGSRRGLGKYRSTGGKKGVATCQYEASVWHVCLEPSGESNCDLLVPRFSSYHKRSIDVFMVRAL